MWDYCPSPKSSKLAMLDKNLPVTGNPWGCMHTAQLHCVQKNVTTSSAITYCLLLRVLAIDRCFYFSTLPISCTYFNLGKLSNLQQNLKNENFIGRCNFDLKSLSKQYDARKTLSEFLDNGWKVGSIDSLLKRIRKTDTLSGKQQETALSSHSSRGPCAQSAGQAKKASISP